MKQTSLYRHFDADGKLLYVGISASFMARLCQHSSTSHWYWRIAKVEVEHFKTRAHALYAEALAIRDERPMLIRMAKTAQHAGTEVYHLHRSAIPKDLRAILESRGVVIKCAA